MYSCFINLYQIDETYNRGIIITIRKDKLWKLITKITK
jgi:hypothetical protein